MACNVDLALSIDCDVCGELLGIDVDYREKAYVAIHVTPCNDCLAKAEHAGYETAEAEHEAR